MFPNNDTPFMCVQIREKVTGEFCCLVGLYTYSTSVYNGVLSDL